MKNLEILSTQQFPSELAEEWVTQPAHDVQLVFDACHVGVVLRAVLFVEIVLGVGAMYGASTLLEWLARVSLLTGGALPATLALLDTDHDIRVVGGLEQCIAGGDQNEWGDVAGYAESRRHYG